MCNNPRPLPSSSCETGECTARPAQVATQIKRRQQSALTPSLACLVSKQPATVSQPVTAQSWPCAAASPSRRRAPPPPPACTRCSPWSSGRTCWPRRGPATAWWWPKYSRWAGRPAAAGRAAGGQEPPRSPVSQPPHLPCCAPPGCHPCHKYRQHHTSRACPHHTPAALSSTVPTHPPTPNHRHPRPTLRLPPPPSPPADPELCLRPDAGLLQAHVCGPSPQGGSVC